MDNRAIPAFIIATTVLLAFGFFAWKKPYVVITGLLRADRRLRQYPPEYRDGVREAYLRQVKAVSLGFIMAGFVIGAIAIALLINPSLIQYFSYGA